MSKLFDLDEQYNRERIIKDVSMVETEFIRLGRDYDKLKAELEQVKGERDEIKRLAKDVNSLLNSTMTWMQEEGIAVPFVMTLMIGSLGEKSEKLAAALKDAK